MKGKFKVTDNAITPKPTDAEERFYDTVALHADTILIYTRDALHSVQDVGDERRLRIFPCLRRERITKLVARAETALLELEDELEEISDSDDDVYEKAALLNELASKIKHRKLCPHGRR